MGRPRIRRLRRRGDVDGLLRALEHRELVSLGGGERADLGAGVRVEALRALAEVATPADVPRISVALRDPDPLVRQCAVRVVRRVDPEAAADAIAATLVRAGKEFLEARLEALEALEDLVRQGGGGVARKVAFAIVENADASIDQVTQDSFRGFVDHASQEEVDALIAELVERLPALGGRLENAQVVLAWLAPRTVEPLIQALDREGGYREPAAAVLGAIRDTRALQPLHSIIDDRRADVRRVTVWALGELRDPRAAEPLMKATMDDEYIVRRQAGEALDAMGSVALMAGVANMIRSLETRTDGPTVARLVEEGLERTPPSGRSGVKNGGTWAPPFMERLLARGKPS